jgi:hypothetical protein
MQPFTLIYLQPKLQNDRMFLREFFANFNRLAGKAIVLQGSEKEDVSHTEFMTKRISANLSEYMVANAGFSGYQMQFIRKEGDLITINQERLSKLFHHVQAVVVNDMVQEAGEYKHADAGTCILAFRAVFPELQVTLFPDEVNSPLGIANEVIVSEKEMERFAEAYPEQLSILGLAKRVLPVRFATAKNFAG